MSDISSLLKMIKTEEVYAIINNSIYGTPIPLASKVSNIRKKDLIMHSLIMEVAECMLDHGILLEGLDFDTLCSSAAINSATATEIEETVKDMINEGKYYYRKHTPYDRILIKDISEQTVLYRLFLRLVLFAYEMTNDIWKSVIAFCIRDFMDYNVVYTEHDLAIYWFLLTYIEDCLRSNCVSLSIAELNFNCCNVTDSKIRSFFKRYDWYGTYTQEFMYGFNDPDPTPAKIINGILGRLEECCSTILGDSIWGDDGPNYILLN